MNIYYIYHIIIIYDNIISQPPNRTNINDHGVWPGAPIALGPAMPAPFSSRRVRTDLGPCCVSMRRCSSWQVV